MTNLSSKNKKKLLWEILGGVLLLGLIASLYTAYFYQVAEDYSTPPYLAYLQRNHLDNYVDAGNFKLHYVHEGQVGPTVMLIPGGGVWMQNLSGLMNALSAHYSVYLIDPPGDGYTTALHPNVGYTKLYTLQNIDESLLAFANNLHLPKISVIGSSWGGGYGLNFAEQHPDRVVSYVSLDGTGLNLPDSREWQLLKIPTLGEMLTKLSSSRSSYASYIQKLSVNHTITGSDLDNLYPPYTIRANLASMWMLERNLNWQQTDQKVGSINIPELVIWGKDDTVLNPVKFTTRWHQLAPEATIIELNDAGHLVYTDQPLKVATDISQFLDRVAQ